MIKICIQTPNQLSQENYLSTWENYIQKTESKSDEKHYTAAYHFQQETWQKDHLVY